MSVPPRWLHCPRKGQIIAGKFLPFKTPLGPRYDSEVPDECRFNIAMLVAYLGALQRKMGLVIDLTKTDRFYDKKELQQLNIGHYKLKCEGFEQAPTQEQVDEFKQVCFGFIQTHPEDIIGIHCTHGYNRTGFLIAAYLVEKEDWSLEAAVAAFSQARPPGIYKEHYLTDLSQRYGGGTVDIRIPPRPDWCFEGDDPGDDGDGDSKGKGSRKKGTKRKEFHDRGYEYAKFMEGVVGVGEVVSPTREEVQAKCQSILQWERSGFPGSQPVSMDVKNIRLLHEKPYRVSWKADGTRYMMYLKGPGEVYMVGRDNCVFEAPQLSFPARKRPGDCVRDTLVDGEMILDKTPDGVRPRFLMYDIMQFEGNADVAKCDHKVRTLCIEKELIGPREEAAQKGSLDKHKEPFGVRAKTFWDVAETRMVLEKYVPKITHENDGLIFSPSAVPYCTGQDDELLKWKPADLNTVDFRLNIVTENQAGMLPEKIGQLFVGGCKMPFSTINFKSNPEARLHNGRIVECSWDKHTGWHFLRVRKDKNFPNSCTTAQSVIQSICQPVTKEWLLEVAEKHRWELSARPSHTGAKRPHDEDGSSSKLMPPPKRIPHSRT